MATAIDIAVTTTTYNVSITAEPNEYIVNITTNSGGGGAVDSVNGQTGVVIIPIPTNTSDLVNDGEDGVNPFITAADVVAKSLAETLAVDNKTNDVPIVSNNGNGYAYVNDEQTVIGNDLGGAKRIIMNEDSFDIITPVRIIIDGKGLHLGTTTDGFGLPILTTTQMNAIGFPTNGMIVWNTTESATYQYNGATWNALGGSAVDSVNGQTGVVVLDAADVGADAITTAATGAVISFATRQVYNSIASPSSSNLTDNLTGAQIGIVQKIYHNAGTAPTVPAGWVKRGTGSYVTSTLNIIYAEWSVGTTVEYWITQ